MSKNKNANDHKSDQSNRNKGTNGTNKTNAKVHGNRGKQLNDNNANQKKK